MSEKLLTLYNEELSHIHRLSANFAQSNPRIASQLRLGQRRNEDPFMGHLLESFAFMSARIREQIENDEAIIAEHFLQVLYPQYTRQLPATAIVQLQPNKNCQQAITVPKNTLIATNMKDVKCRFSTCYEFDCTPIKVTNAVFVPWTEAKKISHEKQLKSCLELTIEVCDWVNVDDFSVSNLAFYINCDNQYRHDLLELLLNHFQAAYFKNNESDLQVIENGKISSRGLNSSDSLLPSPGNVNTSHQLFTEYFYFPEKFFFIDLDIGKDTMTKRKTLQIYLYFDKSSRELEKQINESCFLTNCTPLINTYKTQADPITLTDITEAYPVKVDAYSHSDNHGVYSIDSVNIVTESGENVCAYPLYKNQHHKNPDIYWQSRIQEHWKSESFTQPGHDTVLTLIDNSHSAPQWLPGSTCLVDITATNKQLPTELSSNSNSLYFWHDNFSNLCKPFLITAFTMPRYPIRDEKQYWSIVRHLSQQQQLFSQQNDTLEWLQSYLHLYSGHDEIGSQPMIDAILSIDHKMITRHHPSDVRQGGCKGTAITVAIDTDKYHEEEYYLFSRVLNEFFIDNTSINSFIELTLTNSFGKILVTWPAQIGREVLI